MKYIAFCFMCFLLCTTTGRAQNLVPNGSFEDGDPCPTATAAINELDHWYFGIQLPDEDWWNWPSPDWFHSCSPSEVFQPPSVGFGYQEPLTGDGMAGVITYVDYATNGREVLSIELIEDLVIGETYTFTMCAVRAISQAIGGSANRLGMKLTTFPFWTTFDGPITNSAHFSIDAVLADTANWNTFTTEFIADSAYKFLHIGNFFDDQQTTAITYDYVVNFLPYYFLDDITLIKEPLTATSQIPRLETLYAFPNPATDNVSIKCRTRINRIQVLGLNGQIVFEKNLKQVEEFELNISPWSSGVYILKAIDGEGAIHHLKLIKN